MPVLDVLKRSCQRLVVALLGGLFPTVLWANGGDEQSVCIAWNMATADAAPTTAVDGVAAEMSYVGMDYKVEDGYMRFSADYWIENGGLNSDIYLEYLLIPQTDTLLVDSIDFDAMRSSTDMQHFSAAYSVGDTAIWIVDHSRPDRNTFMHYGCGLPQPAMVVPGDTFVVRFYPYPTSALNKKKYTITYKNMTFYGRFNARAPLPELGGDDNNTDNVEKGSTATPYLSVPHGIYEEPFELSVLCDDEAAKIYYTTDGTVPSDKNGKRYSSPLKVSGTMVLRVVAMNDTLHASEVVTATYLFLDDVMRQQGVPEGYPEEWGKYATRSGYAKGDYEVDPEMTADAHFCELMKEGLRSLPIVSLVTDPAHFFNKVEDEQTGGIYIYTGAPSGSGVGRGWERPVSFELFDAEGIHDLQVNCGVKLHGGHSRLPEKSPKHSLRLVFRDEFGPGKLRYPLFGIDEPAKHNAVVLRTAFCNSWHHQDSDQREIAVYSRDMWAKHTQKAMGHLTTNGMYAHLFINGLYWGMYNPTERIDDDFCDAHLGGKKEDYDVIKVEEYGVKHVVMADAGSLDKWNEMFALADNAADMATYYRLQGLDAEGNRDLSLEPLLDVENFVDYMLINYYGGNTDWDSHNWLAVRNRVKANEGFHFICWDTEHILKSVNDSRLGTKTSLSPTALFHKLMENRLFERYFIDRVQKHCYDNGLLTPHLSAQRWLALDAIIDTALYCEQARWGDYRRDVHKYTSQGELYTKENHYDTQRRYLLDTYFPQRTGAFVTQLQDKGWFPVVEAPTILFEDASAVNIDTLEYGEGLTLAGEGSIYYTIDGEEPVSWIKKSAGAPTASALIYNGELIVSDRDFTLKTIANHGGEWSPMREQRFVVRHTDTGIAPEPMNQPMLTAACNGEGLLTLSYTLRSASDVDITLCDLRGAVVQHVVAADRMAAGTYTVPMSASHLPAGVYLCRLVAGRHVVVVKVVCK